MYLYAPSNGLNLSSFTESDAAFRRAFDGGLAFVSAPQRLTANISLGMKLSSTRTFFTSCVVNLTEDGWDC
ncbi:hypothetical protein GT037_009362 [Alternaria burnsii]|uniref:Uncharacterized protein n=1 Tax=Alternaria burnsii TaxID=1187904 RepID=A0A8H7ECA4_9PLEO|nr:uncharacterized protein GT037_009362 [Alternaria burnsii]KAF7672331.1 hypothetical protein GT037_009362 [Alternaria burnsii]